MIHPTDPSVEPLLSKLLEFKHQWIHDVILNNWSDTNKCLDFITRMIQDQNLKFKVKPEAQEALVELRKVIKDQLPTPQRSTLFDSVTI